MWCRRPSRYAQRAVEAKLPLKKARDIKIQFPNAEAFFDFARGAVAPLAKNYPAPGKCIDAVEAAVLKPFDEGMKVERTAFTELLNSTESKALRHVFFAIRAASKIPDVPSRTPLRPVESVAIIGAGTMGGGIAMNFANAGVPVTVLETGQAALDKGLGVVRKNYERTLKKGRLTQKDFDKRLGLITGTLSYDDIAQADLVIEAVFEDMQVKKQVFETLDAKMKPGAILASNTSTLDLDKIAAIHAPTGRCGRAAFLQPRQCDQAAGNRARSEDRQGRAGDQPAVSQNKSRRSASSPVSATGSSAIAC